MKSIEVENEQLPALVIGIFSTLITQALKAYEALAVLDGHTVEQAAEAQFYRHRYLQLRLLREQFENEMAREIIRGE